MGLLPSGLPDRVGDDEDLARFLFQSNQYTPILVKPAAFLPSSASLESSVFRHGREPADSLRELGQLAAGIRPLRGVAVVKAREVRAVGLRIDPHEPPRRHAAIRGWPMDDGDPEMAKARRKELAISLASAAGAPLLL